MSLHTTMLLTPGDVSSSHTDLLVGVPGATSSINGELKKNESLVLANALKKIEHRSGVKREYLAYGVISLLALYLIVGHSAEFLCNLISFAYPAYTSVKAVRAERKEDEVQWLTYWTVFGTFSVVDVCAEDVMHVFPIYFLFKTLFLLYLSLPNTRGAEKLYVKALNPAIARLDALLKKDQTERAR